MDFGHSLRFATRQARNACGDLYPGPVLMPRGILRAIDPLLAVAVGAPSAGTEAFSTALERMLRGRPDGPLMLALWATSAAGEIPHSDLRKLAGLMPGQLPERPATREEFLAWLEPRVSIVARCVLAVAQRQQPDVLEPAEKLGCGLVLTRVLCDLPDLLSRGRIPLPLTDLEDAGCSDIELSEGVRSPAVHRFLSIQCAWARELLDEGLPACDGVGSRLRRGMRAGVLRARALLDQVEQPNRDLFRRRPALSLVKRWACAVRALWPVLPEAKK